MRYPNVPLDYDQYRYDLLIRHFSDHLLNDISRKDRFETEDLIEDLRIHKQIDLDSKLKKSCDEFIDDHYDKGVFIDYFNQPGMTPERLIIAQQHLTKNLDFRLRYEILSKNIKNVDALFVAGANPNTVFEDSAKTVFDYIAETKNGPLCFLYMTAIQDEISFQQRERLIVSSHLRSAEVSALHHLAQLCVSRGLHTGKIAKQIAHKGTKKVINQILTMPVNETTGQANPSPRIIHRFTTFSINFDY